MAFRYKLLRSALCLDFPPIEVDCSGELAKPLSCDGVLPDMSDFHRRAPLLSAMPILLALGCGGGDEGSIGQDVFQQPSASGNTFACAHCHSLEEPTSDGQIRPGHPIGDATHRPNFKNGQLATVLEAVNSCRVEWMGAPAWQEEDAEWVALRTLLNSQGSDAEAPAISFEIVSPPADVSGGDVSAGASAFADRCVICHGVDGIGTERAPKLAGLAIEPTYLASRVRLSGRAGSPIYPGLDGGRMPFWAADRLSDTQLVDIAAYVQDLEASNPSDAGVGTDGMPGRTCASTHPDIGKQATLVERFHDVSGTATIVDDCTIEITDFVFDGNGVDIQIYSGVGGDYQNGFSMSENLLRSGGYQGETLQFQLPENKTLGDLDGISVWCVPVGVSFGDGLFQSL